VTPAVHFPLLDALGGQLLLAAWAVFGHTALWIALLNRSHGFALPRRLLKAIEAVLIPAVPLMLAGYLWWMADDATDWTDALRRAISGLSAPLEVSLWLAVYVFLCWAWGAWVAVVWTYRGWLRPLPAALLSNDSRHLDVEAEVGRRPVAGWPTKMLAAFPGNQILDIEVNDKRLVVPRLPAELDGMSIAHISDLHYTGRFSRDFYNVVVDQTNALGADLIAVTGDIIAKQHCVAWLASTLGRLRADCGVYFVLGNHDLKIAEPDEIRAELCREGLVDVGGRWQEVVCRNRTVLLAGNEHPWFRPRPDAADRPGRRADSSSEDVSPFSVLLAHTPDQIGWARRHDFDLVLAGHNHGGQIRVPVVGPIVSPSFHGVRYASGLFHEPPCLMHVSRGVAGDKPIRLNCPPEITKLVLVRPVDSP